MFIAMGIATSPHQADSAISLAMIRDCLANQSATARTMNDIYKSGGVIEDFKVEDGKIYQVRHQNMDKFRKVMGQVEELNSRAKYRPEIRPSYSFPEVACLDIVKRYGRDMHPRRFPKMSETEKDKFRRIVRTEYPYCIVGGFSKRFF